MNPSTFLGMFGGVAILILTIAMTSEDIGVFFNFPGLAIVLGGTLAATLLAYPWREVLKVSRTFLSVLATDRLNVQVDQKDLMRAAFHWYQGDIKKVEQDVLLIQNPFLRTGIQMVIDRVPADEILALMEWRIQKLKTREAAQAQVYRTMAMFSPAFGMLGTLIGLINMLYGMDMNNFESIGINLALALITTLYGIVLANLLFKPIAIKFERRTEKRVVAMNLLMEGVMMMSRGHSPAYIREYLASFLAQYPDDLYAPLEESPPAPATKEADIRARR